MQTYENFTDYLTNAGSSGKFLILVILTNLFTDANTRKHAETKIREFKA